MLSVVPRVYAATNGDTLSVPHTRGCCVIGVAFCGVGGMSSSKREIILAHSSRAAKAGP